MYSCCIRLMWQIKCDWLENYIFFVSLFFDSGASVHCNLVYNQKFNWDPRSSLQLRCFIQKDPDLKSPNHGTYPYCVAFPWVKHRGRYIPGSEWLVSTEVHHLQFGSVDWKSRQFNLWLHKSDGTFKLLSPSCLDALCM